MGVRGEIFSKRVMLPNRTYFFNVKENRMGDLYLNIVESKNRESGGFDRQSVVLFADDLQEFLKGFDESLRVMEKAVREKKNKGGGDQKRADSREGQPRQRKDFRNREGYPKQQQGFGGDRGNRQKQRQGYGGDKDKYPKQRKDFSGGKDRNPGQRQSFGNDKKERGYRDRGADKSRRVIVKKHD